VVLGSGVAEVVSEGIVLDVGGSLVVGGVEVLVGGSVVTTDELEVVAGSTLVELVVSITEEDVLSTVDVLEVTPVPTTCRLLGMMPCGTSSACIVANPKPNPRSASIVRKLCWPYVQKDVPKA
jgi:hypothetical protein